jgi:hypothetical protein
MRIKPLDARYHCLRVVYSEKKSQRYQLMNRLFLFNMNFRFSSFNSPPSINLVRSAAYPASFFIRSFTVLMLAAMILRTTVQCPEVSSGDRLKAGPPVQ